MILFALAISLIFLYFYNARIFMYGLMVFYVLFDMLDGFYEDEKIFAAMRYLIPLLLISVFMINASVLRMADTLLIIVLLYMMTLLVFSAGDFIISAKTCLAVTLTLLMMPIGRHIGRHVDILDDFEGFNRFLLIALPLYIVLANLLDFGESYSDAFTTGFLVTSRIYIVPIVVFLAIHYMISGKRKPGIVNGIDLLFILINIGVIIINTRRTALAMLVLALLIYAVLNRGLILKMAALGIVLIAALALTYPLYEETLTAQLEERARIQDLDTYEEEGRYLETLYILDHHARRERVSEILFGITLFDTYDFGTRYFGRDRPIHSDINMIVYSTGIVGVLLFGLLFWRYFFAGNGKIAEKNRKLYFPLLVMFLVVLIPGRFIGTLTYAPLLMLILSGTKAWRPAGSWPRFEGAVSVTRPETIAEGIK